MQMSDRKFDELADLPSENWPAEIMAAETLRTDGIAYPYQHGKPFPLALEIPPQNDNKETWN